MRRRTACKSATHSNSPIDPACYKPAPVIFIDTNVAIALRDADRATLRQIDDLPELPVISIITRIKLENGVNAEPGLERLRRRLLDRFP